jgi:hypothetical protein
MSGVAEVAARLQERIDRYNAALDNGPDADMTEILSAETAALRRELLVAALTDAAGQIADLDGLDAWPFWLAAWSAEFRDNAFAVAGDEKRSRIEATNAMRLFLLVNRVRPDRVPSHQRARIYMMTVAGTLLDLPCLERELAEVFSVTKRPTSPASTRPSHCFADRSTEKQAIGLSIGTR